MGCNPHLPHVCLLVRRNKQDVHRIKTDHRGRRRVTEVGLNCRRGGEVGGGGIEVRVGSPQGGGFEVRVGLQEGEGG